MLDRTSKDIEAEFDVVNIIRSKRMHGFGLHFLHTAEMRNLLSRLAFSRPLRGEDEDVKRPKDPTDMDAIEDKWYFIDNLQPRDKFKIAFFKRYGGLINKYLNKKKKKGPRRLKFDKN